MKFYVLKHPKFGYLKSKTLYREIYTNSTETAKKWPGRNDPIAIRTQSYSKDIKECDVIEIEYEIGEV